MRNRGVLRAAAVKAFGRGVLVVVASAMLVTAGQARVGHAPARAHVGGTAALAPVTFTYTGREQTYTVPSGVATLEVQAVGANGGAPSQPGNPEAPTGGTGGMVIGELAVGAGSPVTPGETLYLGVGGTPTGRAGGFNGGGSAVVENGNGGGGATDVRTCSPPSTSCANGAPSQLTRLIVAAGGGGAGGCDSDSCNVPCDISCGSGGSAGQPGSDAGLDIGAGEGGGAGTLVAPGGAGGGVFPVFSARPGGIDGTGGRGAIAPANDAGGGGGGAGYYGGGGGGFATATTNSGATVDVSAGGGGGANFASPLAASGVSFSPGDGTPRLLITPRPASAIRITRIFYNSPGADTGSNHSLNAEYVRLTNTSRSVQQLRGWSITNAAGHVYRFAPLRLRPRASVTVHTGRGRDTAADRHWNRRAYSWDNRRDLAQLRTAQGTLADQCRYDNAQASQISC